ncbi:MAG: PIN domain-containing protein [Acidimicrobiales bacterium]
MIVDTSALLSFFDRDEPTHDAVVDLLKNSRDPLVVSPFVLAELDYLVGTRIGVTAEVSVLREIGGGAWELAGLDAADTMRAAGVVERYGDQEIGLADASNAVLAQRYGTRRIATLDRRHFVVLRPLQGGRFTVVP